MLSAILSHLFLPNNHLQNCGHKDFVSALEMEEFPSHNHNQCNIGYTIICHALFLTDPYTEHYLPEHRMGTNGTTPTVLPLFPTQQFLQPHFWAHLLQVLIFQLLKSCLSALWQLMAVTVTRRLNGDPWTVDISEHEKFCHKFLNAAHIFRHMTTQQSNIQDVPKVNLPA